MSDSTPTPAGDGFLTLLQPCPLRACQHSYGTHDWEEPGVRPMCCAEGCDCGKRPEDLSNEEWS